jgi:CyaY protein
VAPLAGIGAGGTEGVVDADAAAGSVSGPFWPQPAAPMTATTNRALGVNRRHAEATFTLEKLIRRILSTMPGTAASSSLSDTEYHALTQALLARVEAQADRWLQDDVIDIDTHRSGGLLELRFPDGSKIVINTQPPLQEMWLAAKGGGFHFRYVDGRWLDTRDGGEFMATLSLHASRQAGRALVFSA